MIEFYFYHDDKNKYLIMPEPSRIWTLLKWKVKFAKQAKTNF